MLILISILFLISLLILAYFFPLPSKKLDSYYDAILVLGCPANNDGTISSQQKERTDKAIQLFLEGKAPKVIFSGSNVQNAFIEAEIMAEYALNQINKDSIILETKARNTFQNFKFTKEYPYKKLLVVTSPFHVRRAAFFARKFYTDIHVIGCKKRDSFNLYLWEYTRMWICLYYEWKLSKEK